MVEKEVERRKEFQIKVCARLARRREHGKRGGWEVGLCMR